MPSGRLMGVGRKDECVNGHDLTDERNVRVVKRTRDGKVYMERQCAPCGRERSREWWANNRAKEKK